MAAGLLDQNDELDQNNELRPSRTVPFFLATKNHKSHKKNDLLNRTFKLFVDFVPFRG